MALFMVLFTVWFMVWFMIWDTFLTLRGTWGFYLNHVIPHRDSKSYRVVGGVGGP